MNRFFSRLRHWLAQAIGGALLTASLLGTAWLASAQDQSIAKPDEVIFARKILMDSINNNMDDLEAMTSSGNIDLNEGRAHADIISVMLMAFPHLFPPATNQWKPNVQHDPGTDTFASPDVWTRYVDFYTRASAASKAAYNASRAANAAEFKNRIAELRSGCDACHAAFLKKE